MLVVNVLALFAFLLAALGADALGRAAGLKGPEGDGTGTRATRGAALLTIAGGVAMAADVAGAALVGAAVAMLAVLGVVSLLAERRRVSATPPGRGWTLVAGVLGLALLALLALPPSFNAVDDGYAYVAFMREVANAGTSLAQPFSERRLFTYGGHFPLAGLLDSLAGPEALSAVDPGLGLALIGLLVVERVRAGRTPALAGLAVLALFAGFIAAASPIKNTIPILLPAAFASLMMLRLVETAPPGGRRLGTERAVEMGLLAGAAATFRATSLPFALAVLGAWCAVEAWGELRRRRAPWAALLAPFAMAAALVPFALVLQGASGTPLFPLLGPGVHASRHDGAAFVAGTLAEKLAGALDSLATDPGLLLATLAALAGVVGRWREGDREGCARNALGWCAVAVAALAIAQATEGIALLRYSFSFSIALPVAVLATARWPRAPSFAMARAGRSPFVAAAMLPAVSAAAGVWAVGPQALLDSFDARLAPRYAAVRPSPAELASASAVTAALPEGATLVAYWPRAYLLPMGRNRILIDDQPGRAGPDPFWPPADDPEAVRAYLRGAGVDFVLATTADPDDACARLDDPAQWYRRMYEGECAFRRFVESPAMRPRVRLADGVSWLIDLR
ncbi:hypothetical protein NK718_00310 [Alsobacter sp. SYSU M60028]|uniref:Glycosyltransferase RgtA/B/C/D-like domain-containing protein n=1 Tax=Alsobacter ponti TaxID=2962936 RepID=A0ABT1L6C8_9HYPH|nr:hypothetical protein [Alsobacter ponti]MCP8936946.1 hypothetical protein [Alsobacter ponti]